MTIVIIVNVSPPNAGVTIFRLLKGNQSYKIKSPISLTRFTSRDKILLEVMYLRTIVLLIVCLFVSTLWAGQIALDLQSTPVNEVLTKLSQETKEEIITEGTIQAKLTGSIRCSTLEEALNALSVLHPSLKWAKLVFPATEKISNEDIITTAKALKLVKFSKVVAEGKDGDLFFMRSSKASLGEKNLRTVYVVWEEMSPANIAQLASLSSAKLSPQDYINLNWLMLNSFLSMTPEEKKQVLFGAFNMVFQDPALLQRIMSEYFSMLTTLSPEEMGQLIGASFKALQSIPPEFWNQMTQSMTQWMQTMGPQIRQMIPQMPGGGSQ
jgi:hypothetical protein